MRIIVYIWPDIDICAMWLFFLENYVFLVYMYYTHSSYRSSVVGKNCAYYIRIFMVYYIFMFSQAMFLPVDCNTSCADAMKMCTLVVVTAKCLLTPHCGNIVCWYDACRFLTLCTGLLGSVAANTVRVFKPDQLPLLLVISRSRGIAEVVQVLHGMLIVPCHDGLAVHYWKSFNASFLRIILLCWNSCVHDKWNTHWSISKNTFDDTGYF